MTAAATRRVLFVAWAPFFSGAERALLLTLRSLDRARYDPVVVSGTGGEFVEQVRAMGIACDVATLSPLEKRRPLAGLKSVASVVKSAVRHRAALIHANEAPRFQPAGYAAKLLGLPAVTHVRFPAGAAGYDWFLRPGFQRALFVSHALLDQAMGESRDLFEGRSEVLHDGVEAQPTWTTGDALRCRRELGLPEHCPIVAMAGQVAEVKGIWEFVEAARILSSGTRELLFVVVGDDLKTGGVTRRAMEARVEQLGLSARFRFLGFRNDAPRIVQAFDIIAVPSHIEPLGNATLEAMAAGRPVVGSRVGGIPEMVVDGETGVLVPPRDPASLASALGALVDNAALRARMGASARQRAAVTFSIDAHGARLQRVYDELCASRVTRSGSKKEAA